MCELKEYCNEDCNKCDIMQQIKFNEAVEECKKTIIEIFKPIAEKLIDVFECIKKIAFNETVRAFNELMEATKIYNNAPNSRIKHLAFYGKKARVRKKNLKRLIKQVGGKENGGN